MLNEYKEYEEYIDFNDMFRRLDKKTMQDRFSGIVRPVYIIAKHFMDKYGGNRALSENAVNAWLGFSYETIENQETDEKVKENSFFKWVQEEAGITEIDDEFKETLRSYSKEVEEIACFFANPREIAEILERGERKLRDQSLMSDLSEKKGLEKLVKRYEWGSKEFKTFANRSKEPGPNVLRSLICGKLSNAKEKKQDDGEDKEKEKSLEYIDDLFESEKWKSIIEEKVLAHIRKKGSYIKKLNGVKAYAENLGTNTTNSINYDIVFYRIENDMTNGKRMHNRILLADCDIFERFKITCEHNGHIDELYNNKKSTAKKRRNVLLKMIALYLLKRVDDNQEYVYINNADLTNWSGFSKNTVDGTKFIIGDKPAVSTTSISEELEETAIDDDMTYGDVLEEDEMVEEVDEEPNGVAVENISSGRRMFLPNELASHFKILEIGDKEVDMEEICKLVGGSGFNRIYVDQGKDFLKEICL